jgi:hypothetical protein
MKQKAFLVLVMVIAGAIPVFAGGGGQAGTNTSPYKNFITFEYFSQNSNSQGLMAGFTKKAVEREV